MRYDKKQLVCTILLSIGLCAGLKSSILNASSEVPMNLYSNQHSIEILVLSRGRGVPETAFTVFQEIKALANSALESGSATAVRQEKIGLEGEARLCIIFRDDQSLAEIGNQIRELASNIELLQVNNYRCSGN